MPDSTYSTEIENLRISLAAEAGEGAAIKLKLTFSIAAGWKLFGTGATGGIPIALTTAEPSSLADIIMPTGDLTDTCTVTATLRGATAGTEVTVHVQLCSGQICQRPRQIVLPVSLVPSDYAHFDG
ncbi:hypothetical protein [Streptomyces mirabilis]|uniref:hypothetical protein n=1 Tax=Streptomyces mirabilis TaxID=68239 RepID=UPI003332B6EC